MADGQQLLDIGVFQDDNVESGHKLEKNKNVDVTKPNATDQEKCTMSINEYIAGAIGGVAGVIVGHPFDTTKIQMQIRTVGDHKLAKTSDAFSSVRAQGWKRGLFRGMMFPVMSYGVVNSTFFGVYGSTIKLLEPDHTVYPTNTQVFLAGCVAGTAQLFFSCPVEVIKCTLQAQIPLTLPTVKEGMYTKPTQPRTYYSGPIECSTSIYRTEGIRGFYKGTLAMFIRDVPSYGLYLLCYEGLFHLMAHHGLTDNKGAFAAVIAGGIAGCVSWGAIMPLDVIKSRLQVDHGGRYRGFWDCTIKSVQKAGFSVLFRGTVITLVRAFPVNAITFLVYSQLLQELNYINPPQVMRKQVMKKEPEITEDADQL